jgi:hypothetical protein
MGAAQSTPPDPVPDPNIFVNIGCVGLISSDYYANRLSAAPFLSVQFQAPDYYSMISNILLTFKQIKPGWSPTPRSNDMNYDMNFNMNDLFLQKIKVC